MVFLVVGLSYLLGSIPTSIIVGRIFFGKDPRQHGSLNAGGTNAFRVFGWKAGTVVTFIDIGKGVVATLLISRLAAGSIPTDIARLLSGCSAILGHIWTVFAGFRGGKGVGTAAGMLFGLHPVALVVSVMIFIVVLLSTGFVSMGSMTAGAAFPMTLLVMGLTGSEVSNLYLFATVALAFLIVFTHRKNIRRLLSGEEQRFQHLMVFRRRR